MILDDVRDKAFESLQSLKGRLEESDLYNKIKERYDTFSPRTQKVVLVGSGFLLVLVIFQFPKSYYDAGSENLALFEENRDLVLNLYRVKRMAVTTPQGPTPLEPSVLSSRARDAVTSARIQAEQIKGISNFDNAGAHASTNIPKDVTQAGVEIRLANLNLSQIVDIGHALTNTGAAKIVGLDMRPGSAVGNYFDATFKVVSFNFPVTPAAKAPAKQK